MNMTVLSSSKTFSCAESFVFVYNLNDMENHLLFKCINILLIIPYSSNFFLDFLNGEKSPK